MSRTTSLSDVKTKAAFKNVKSYANYRHPNERTFLMQRRFRLIYSLTPYVSTFKVYYSRQIVYEKLEPFICDCFFILVVLVDFLKNHLNLSSAGVWVRKLLEDSSLTSPPASVLIFVFFFKIIIQIGTWGRGSKQ